MKATIIVPVPRTMNGFILTALTALTLHSQHLNNADSPAFTGLSVFILERFFSGDFLNVHIDRNILLGRNLFDHRANTICVSFGSL